MFSIVFLVVIYYINFFLFYPFIYVIFCIVFRPIIYN